MRDVIDHEFGISAVDSGYLRPQLGAIHLLVENGRAAIIDCGVNDSVTRVLRALEAKGLRAEHVDYVILTHIHLDHAGGAGLLMSKLPNARLTVHPRGTRHMIDPGKLIAGTIAVYGERHMREMYGEILPIDAARVMQMIHRNKRYKLAGQDKLRVEADLPEMAERVERVKQLFAELAAPPEPVKSKR